MGRQLANSLLGGKSVTGGRTVGTANATNSVGDIFNLTNVPARYKDFETKRDKLIFFLFLAAKRIRYTRVREHPITCDQAPRSGAVFAQATRIGPGQGHQVFGLELPESAASTGAFTEPRSIHRDGSNWRRAASGRDASCDFSSTRECCGRRSRSTRRA